MMRMSAEEDFSLSWDSLIKGMTSGVVVLVFMLAVVCGLVLADSFLALGLVLTFFSVLIIPLLWAPQRYLVKDDIVMVRRRIGDEDSCQQRTRTMEMDMVGIEAIR